jgi:hypothetical protein
MISLLNPYALVIQNANGTADQLLLLLSKIVDLLEMPSGTLILALINAQYHSDHSSLKTSAIHQLLLALPLMLNGNNALENLKTSAMFHAFITMELI